MSGIVERVARALCAAGGGDPDASAGFLLQPQRKLWENHIAEARAAIEAMREPTTGIVIAIAASLVCWEEVTPGEVWDSVIDEALK